jgi:type II secretory pathway pseudopilin PulG
MRRARSDGDSGVTLVEVMVACVIFMILASGVSGMLLTTFKTTNDDKLRVAAANLASRELEIVRQYFNSGNAAVLDVTNSAHTPRTNYYPLPGGTQGQPLVVDGVSFTVREDVAVQVLGPGASACDGGSAVAHPSYQLTATVTWPRMGATKPVVDETVLTPPKGVVQDQNYGYLAVKVVGASGGKTTNVPVTVSGPAGTFTSNTDSSGCAVLQLSQAGTYTASISPPGPTPYVSDQGSANPSLANISVTIGGLTNKTMYYDEAAELDATLTTASGYSLPATLPQLTLANTGIQPTGILTVASSGSTTQVTNLWPFTSGYTVWAGSCADSDPALSGGTRVGPVVIPGGTTGTAQVPLAPLDVTVLDNTGSPVADATVTAQEQTTTQSGSHCGSDATLTLGVTDANGHLASSLPNGSWQISSNGTSSNAFSVTGAPASAEIDLP